MPIRRVVMKFAGSYDLATTDITREFYFNVGGPHGFMRWGIYIFAALAVAYLVYSLVKRVRLWKMGREEVRTDRPMARIKAVIKYVFLQIKILREGYAGIMHASFFFGFLVLFIVTLIIVVQEDLTGLFFDYHFIHGNFYLIWSLFGDLFGLVVLFGVWMAFLRRYILKPSRLDERPTDAFALGLIFFIALTGFLNEAMRIAITGFPVFEIWSPIGYSIAYLFAGVSVPTLKDVHYVNWWLHMLSAFTFIALLASNKLGHILISILNIYYMNLDNENRDTKYRLPLINPEEFETAESFGVSQVEEFTWKKLMDGDACTRCGRCQDNCPAWLTDKPLSPKKIINDVKDNMEERLPRLAAVGEGETVETTPLIKSSPGSVDPHEFWSCTNCGACLEACPVNIEHVSKMLDMRRYKVLMEGDMASELQTTFVNLESNFNPYGFAFAERGEWVPEDLGIKTLAEDPEVDYLYFVGSAASFDKRNQQVAATLAKILKSAGVKIGILGPEEADSGDTALRTGNEYLFHVLATQNIETFAGYNVKKIICSCPHDYNTLKKEYRSFAEVGVGSDGNPLSYDVEVYHHTEILADLIKNGTIKLNNEVKQRITYHDSCFLGRYNEIYKQPREILKSIPGLELVEMSWHHDKSFCCGAGGGRMFLEEDLGTRINQFRTKDAQATGASTIATACPYCNTMLSDGINELDIQNMRVFDVVELVYQSMEGN